MYMSYCRFEGTKQELSACMREVENCVNEEPGYGDVSPREIMNFKTMVVDFVDWIHDMSLLDDEGNLDNDELDSICKAMIRMRYPVMPEKYTVEEAPFVYTKKGEELGKKYNSEPRTAGTVACFAGQVLREGITADDWMRRGFIERRKSHDAGVEK